jgi:asparagine N-glycosylation enzyme membrane subunit Stt3
MQEPYDRTWLLIPGIAFGGVLITWFSGLPVAGTAGCFLASVLLAYLAYRKPKKDIVSLLTPLYAVLIFFNDSFLPEFLLPIQALYAASLTILVLRLNARFSRKDEVQKRFTDSEEEESADESIPE